MTKKNFTLFDIESEVQKEWVNMPEFSNENLEPYHRITVLFDTKEDFELFVKNFDKTITIKTKSVFYPKSSRLDRSSKYLYKHESNISSLHNK